MKENENKISRRSILRAGAVTAGAAAVVAGPLASRALAANSSLDKVVYVSKAGNNANNGFSWETAKLTIASAFNVLGFGPGTIEIGAGTFDEPGLVPNYGQVLRGRGRYATIVRLTSNGTLLNLTNQSYTRFEHLGFSFASASVTGTLLMLDNAFTHDFIDCQFTGQNAAGQVGTVVKGNAGDTQFVQCYWNTLDVWVQNDSTVNHWWGCIFSGHRTAGIRGGDPTGATAGGGAVFRDCVFRGGGPCYVDIIGKSQGWHFSGCWCDGGGAAVGMRVGNANYGPWLFSVNDCPSMLGGTQSLVLNCASQVLLHGVVFGNAGSFPPDIVIPNPAKVPNGSVAACFSLQGRRIESLVPSTWAGYKA